MLVLLNIDLLSAWILVFPSCSKEMVGVTSSFGVLAKLLFLTELGHFLLSIPRLCALKEFQENENAFANK